MGALWNILSDFIDSFVSQFLSDGTTQLLSGCLRDFRNKPFATRARIEYYQNTLTVLFNNGMTANTEEYEMCLRAEGVVLPKTGYFGVSAATGGLADDHDVFHFLTTSLHAPGTFTEPSQVPDDSAKLAQEYQDYQKKLDQQKEDYHKEHPEEKKDEFEDWFETDNQRELRQIWQSQTQMTDLLKDLSRKMDEVIGRQERTLGLVSINAQGGAPAQVPQQQPGAQPGAVPQYTADTIRRHEVDSILQNQNVFHQIVSEVRNIAVTLQARTDNILQNQARQPTAQVQQAAGYDVQSMISEMRDGLNQIKQGITTVNQKWVPTYSRQTYWRVDWVGMINIFIYFNRVAMPQAQITGCPTVNCLSVTTFLIFTVIQLGIMLAYTLYK